MSVILAVIVNYGPHNNYKKAHLKIDWNDALLEDLAHTALSTFLYINVCCHAQAEQYKYILRTAVHTHV